MQQGPYGYHSVWKNIDNFFTQENMAKIKAELDKRSNKTKQNINESDLPKKAGLNNQQLRCRFFMSKLTIAFKLQVLQPILKGKMSM